MYLELRSLLLTCLTTQVQRDTCTATRRWVPHSIRARGPSETTNECVCCILAVVLLLFAYRAATLFGMSRGMGPTQQVHHDSQVSGVNRHKYFKRPLKQRLHGSMPPEVCVSANFTFRRLGKMHFTQTQAYAYAYMTRRDDVSSNCSMGREWRYKIYL